MLKSSGSHFGPSRWLDGNDDYDIVIAVIDLSTAFWRLLITMMMMMMMATDIL